MKCVFPRPAMPKSVAPGKQIDVCAEVRGVLTDEEVDTLFVRNRSISRPVDLS